jgi:hypothetical protein
MFAHVRQSLDSVSLSAAAGRCHAEVSVTMAGPQLREEGRVDGRIENTATSVQNKRGRTGVLQNGV